MTPDAFAEMVCRATLAVKWVVSLPMRGVTEDGRTVCLSVVYTAKAFDLEVDGRRLNMPTAAREVFRAYMDSL